MLIPKSYSYGLDPENYGDQTRNTYGFSLISPSSSLYIYERVRDNKDSGDPRDWFRERLNTTLVFEKDFKKYCFFYPYGSEINLTLAEDIAIALNYLIDGAKTLEVDNPLLVDIKNKQAQLVSLLREGTDNPNAVKEIIGESMVEQNRKGFEDFNDNVRKMFAESDEKMAQEKAEQENRRAEKEQSKNKKRDNRKAKIKKIAGFFTGPVKKSYDAIKNKKEAKKQREEAIEQKDTLQF